MSSCAKKHARSASKKPSGVKTKKSRNGVRGWQFTLNNYSPDEDIAVQAIDCTYMVFGREIGKEKGTPHLQGFVYFPAPKTMCAVRKLIPRAHLEEVISVEHLAAYNKKDGVFFEKGTCPVSQQRKGELEQARWRAIRLAAQEGRLDDIPEEIRFKNLHLIEAHRIKAMREVVHADTTDLHLWIWGPTGTGKSRSARVMAPKAYSKLCNKWWDNYQGESDVLIEDFDRDHAKLVHHLKIWADRYPFSAEYKGGIFKIRPSRIIVTSNYHPSDIWQEDESLQPILRRFQVIYMGVDVTDERV